MKKEIITSVALSLAGVSAVSAQGNVYPEPNGPPPSTPPPAAYAPVPAYFYVLPPDAGVYASFDAGPTFYQDGELKNFGGPATGKVHYSVGASGDVSMGYNFNKYVAAGVELGVNETTIDSIPGYSLNDAQFYNVPFLGNLTFTLPIPNSLVTPYIGGGVGGSDSVFDPSNMSANGSPNYVTGSENDVVFAWEAYAGLRFQLTPRMTFGLGYKYFGTGNPTFSYPPSPNFDVSFRGVETHSILATFNLRF